MITPEEQNDTPRTMNIDPSPVTGRTFNSISNQYFGGGWFNYAIWPENELPLSVGARIEGILVWDAVGGSMGFRRPGGTISVEPGFECSDAALWHQIFRLRPSFYRNASHVRAMKGWRRLRVRRH